MKKRIKILLVAVTIGYSIFTPNEAQSLTKFQKWEQPSYFRGFNVGLWCSDSECEKTQNDINALKYTQANLAQINVYGVGFRYPEYPYEINSEGIEWISRMVNYCRNAKLQYTIAVRSGPGRYDVSDEIMSPIWEDENQYQVEMYGKMLKEIAEEFLPDTLFVGLNLTVEPDPYSSEYLSPADLKEALIKNNVDLYNIYKTWIDSVRTVAPQLPLIVQSTQYSSPEYWGDPVFIKKQDDPFIVYDFHTYEPFMDFTHLETINGASYPVRSWNETVQEEVLWDNTFYSDVVFAHVRAFQLAYNVPIFMGEFGMLLPQVTGEKYLLDIYKIARRYNWHFALWAWRSDGPNGEVYFNYERFDEVSRGGNYWGIVSTFFVDNTTAVYDNQKSVYPNTFKLFSNYPNPFNPSTVISYQLPVYAHIVLKVYDVLGNEMDILVNDEKPEGYYKVNFNTSKLASGVYYYQIKVFSSESSLIFMDTEKMILLK
jgi:Cellulase (glycosyl hydrolase family 5)/Secretion system C-terminal sorting domain